MTSKFKINWALSLIFYLLTINILLASIDKNKCDLFVRNNYGGVSNICMINQNTDFKDFDFKTVCHVYSPSLDKKILIVESGDDIAFVVDEETIYLCDSEGTKCAEKMFENAIYTASETVAGTGVGAKASGTKLPAKALPIAATVAGTLSALKTLKDDENCQKFIDRVTDSILGNPLEKAERAATKKEEETEKKAERQREAAERRREAAQEARERKNHPKD